MGNCCRAFFRLSAIRCEQVRPCVEPSPRSNHGKSGRRRMDTTRHSVPTPSVEPPVTPARTSVSRDKTPGDLLAELEAEMESASHDSSMGIVRPLTTHPTTAIRRSRKTALPHIQDSSSRCQEIRIAHRYRGTDQLLPLMTHRPTTNPHSIIMRITLKNHHHSLRGIIQKTSITSANKTWKRPSLSGSP